MKTAFKTELIKLNLVLVSNLKSEKREISIAQILIQQLNIKVTTKNNLNLR